jgi:ketosteroid isomerase-like protein
MQEDGVTSILTAPPEVASTEPQHRSRVTQTPQPSSSSRPSDMPRPSDTFPGTSHPKGAGTPRSKGAGTPLSKEGAPLSKEDVVASLFAAFSRRDLLSALSLLHPEVVFQPMTAEVTRAGEPYRGHDGIRRYTQDIEAHWEQLTVHPAQIRAAGQAVVVLGLASGSGPAGSFENAPTTWVVKFKDGLVFGVQIFSDARHVVGALVGDAGAGAARTGAVNGDDGAGAARTGAVNGDDGAGAARTGAVNGDDGAGAARTGAANGDDSAGAARTGAANDAT